MKKINFFGKKKLLLAFEYGVVLSEVALKMDKELTPEIVKRAEAIIIDSFSRNNEQRIALDMTPAILSIFETKL